MDLLVYRDGAALWAGDRLRCALGRSGVTTAKSEGDGASPAGSWPMRRVLYRPDRMMRPPTRLPVAAIAPDDGWCDAPGDRAYNHPVKLPYPASAERLWRDDKIYDLVVVLGHNESPVIDRAGSAIFLHIATGAFAPTAGCVALAIADLLRVLEGADATSRVVFVAADLGGATPVGADQVAPT